MAVLFIMRACGFFWHPVAALRTPWMVSSKEQLICTALQRHSNCNICHALELACANGCRHNEINSIRVGTSLVYPEPPITNLYRSFLFLHTHNASGS